MYGILSYKTNF